MKKILVATIAMMAAGQLHAQSLTDVFIETDGQQQITRRTFTDYVYFTPTDDYVLTRVTIKGGRPENATLGNIVWQLHTVNSVSLVPEPCCNQSRIWLAGTGYEGGSGTVNDPNVREHSWGVPSIILEAGKSYYLSYQPQGDWDWLYYVRPFAGQIPTPERISNYTVVEPYVNADGRLNVYGGGLHATSNRIPAISFDLRMSTQTVGIDVKPDTPDNCFNQNGHGVIPVAILGEDDFDVNSIDQETLSFGGLEVRMRGNKGPLCSLDYVNDDSILDLVCQFEDSSENWEPGEGEATLTGALYDESEFEGTDSICIVP